MSQKGTVQIFNSNKSPLPGVQLTATDAPATDTDASGNYDRNLMLSRERAESVINFLTSRSGIDRKRLVPVGKGSSDPLRSLDARDPKNRRVVFKVVTG